MFVRYLFTLHVLFFFTSSAFYLPGNAPREFLAGTDVQMAVNKLTSVHTQLPFQYYKLPFCKPEVIVDKAENLGEVLSGDRIENSLYKLYMKKDEECKILCRKEYGRKDLAKFQNLIKDDYRAHWLVDNLPATMEVQYPAAESDSDTPSGHLEASFPVGIKVDAQLLGLKDSAGKNGESLSYYIYNHIKFKIYYHENPDVFEGARVVGFFVEPFSVEHRMKEGASIDGRSTNIDGQKYLKSCKVDETSTPQQINSPGEVIWTYDVEWQKSDIPWASRWDVFVSAGTPDQQIHWFSIVNSLMIVLFLTSMVAMIMTRTLKKDITRYNALAVQADEEAGDLFDDGQEETGWKLVHADVFRTPGHPLLLSVFCGSGVQIFFMLVALLLLSMMGLASPTKRGGIATALLFLFVFMGFPAGYVSARMYKMFGQKDWKRNTLFTGLLYPGTVFALFFIVNWFVWNSGSSGAVPFPTMFALLVLWLGISFPLSAFGAFKGFKAPAITHPIRYNHIPRQVPSAPIYMKPIVQILVGGLLPFGAVFIELFFIMSSVWLHQIYFIFGFMFLVTGILFITCAELTVVLCYFQLCSEDYHWWWRSFLTSGSSAFYLFLYSVMYFVTRLDMSKFTPALLYFVYMAIVSLSFFLLTGTVGFFACFFFVRKIYAAIKVE